MTFMIPIVKHVKAIISIYNIRYISILYDSEVLQNLRHQDKLRLGQ